MPKDSDRATSNRRSTSINSGRISTIHPSIFIVISALPFALIACLVVNKFALPIPIGDQWLDPIDAAIKASTNQLHWGDLFAMIEGHRSFTIRLLAVLGAFLVRLSPEIMKWSTWITSCLILATSVELVRHDPLIKGKIATKNLSLATLCLSAVAYAIHDQEGWTDYYFSTWQLSLLFFLIACLIIQRYKTRVAIQIGRAHV